MECMEKEKDSTSSSTTGDTNIEANEEISHTITKQVPYIYCKKQKMHLLVWF